METPDTNVRKKRGRGRTRYVPVSFVPASSPSPPNIDEGEVSELAARFEQSVGIRGDEKAVAVRRVASENATEEHGLGREEELKRLEGWFGGKRRGRVKVVSKGKKWLVVFQTCADARNALREFGMEGYEISRIGCADEETQRIFEEQFGGKEKAGRQQTSDVVARRMIFDALGIGGVSESDSKSGAQRLRRKDFPNERTSTEEETLEGS